MLSSLGSIQTPLHPRPKVLDNFLKESGLGAHICTQRFPKLHISMKTFGKVSCGPASVVRGRESHMKMLKFSHSSGDGQVHQPQFSYQTLKFLGLHAALGGENGQESLQLRQPFGRESQCTVLSSDDPTKNFFDLGPVAVSLRCFSQTNQISDLSQDRRGDFF